MGEIFAKARVQALLWKLTLAMLFLFSIDSIVTATVSVMMDVNWSALSGTQKLIRICLILKAWASSMIALFTNVAHKLQAGDFPSADPTLSVTTVATVTTPDKKEP